MTSDIWKSHSSSIVRDMKNTIFNKNNQICIFFPFFFTICYYFIKKNILPESASKTESNAVCIIT